MILGKYTFLVLLVFALTRGLPVVASETATIDTKHRALLAGKRSILGTILDNARSMQLGLSHDDSTKLEEYFQSLRDIELKLSKEEQWIGVPHPDSPVPEPPPGVDGREEIKLIDDLMIAARQTDSTRMMTFRQPVNTLLTAIGVQVHPHDTSHYHTTLGEKLDASQRRDVAVAYGSNLRTGHESSNCPTILTGRGAGLKLGEDIVLPKNTPLCNAWLTLLHGVGVPVERHGDSTGVLSGLEA